MAHSEVPADKVEAYRKTDYRFCNGNETVTLRVGIRSADLARLYVATGCVSGAFVTACNPLGTIQSAEANEAGHTRLSAALAARAFKVFEGAGADPTGIWPEEKSLFGLGIDLENARSLGVRFQQDAIVWTGSDAVPRLILLR